MTKLGYKMTEIGEILDDWDFLPLTKLANFINGMAFKPRERKEHGIPIVRIENLNNPYAPFNYFDGVVDDKFLLNDGDILLSWSASLGVYIWNHGKAVLNQHIFKVVPNEQVNKKYLFWALHDSVENLGKVTHGSTMKHFQKGELGRTKIALPPLPEQQKIAKILSTVDEAIQRVNDQITKTERLKKGLMQTLLTKGIGHTKFKMTDIGKIPETWKLTNISNSSILKGRIGWQGLTTKEYLKNGDYFLVTGTEFKEGTIDWLRSKYVTKERYDQDPNIQIRINDILLTKDGTIGKVALVNSLPKPATVNTGVFVLRPIDECYDPEYMFYLLQSEQFLKFVETLKAGSTISHLYQYSFNRFRFSLPPILEQRKISQILTGINNYIISSEKYKKKLEELKKGLMQDLLTGKIRVNNLKGVLNINGNTV